MLHTARGHPHWGEGARGPLQFLTSRPHSLTGEQPYVGCAWWESFFRLRRPLSDRPWHSPPSVLSFPVMGLCFPVRLPRPSSVSTGSSWTGS